MFPGLISDKNVVDYSGGLNDAIPEKQKCPGVFAEAAVS
jgi:hypothetical protein